MEGETEYLEQAWRHHEAGDRRVVKFLKYNIALVSVLIVLVLVHRITKLLWHHHVVHLVGDIIGHIHHCHGVVPRVGLDGGH